MMLVRAYDDPRAHRKQLKSITHMKNGPKLGNSISHPSLSKRIKAMNVMMPEAIETYYRVGKKRKSPLPNLVDDRRNAP